MLNEADILENTYFDKCDIIRNTKIINESTGITEFLDVIIYEDIKCAVSMKESLKENLNGDVPSIAVLNKIFLHPKYDIQLGDTIVVTFHNGKKDSYLAASKPFYYHSHSETPITSKERS
ncbi:hypothetical protein [Romboutsia sp. 1001285H_161024_C4]|uniref:hypothetical protein n=1 Tax=Romboutsia sp. 1001285H_161024_C4 TaxID=2787109 RepID=UPI001898D801|nr:hypothetical protein [Romboutsia sp. 1001285H_161024_C4]